MRKTTTSLLVEIVFDMACGECLDYQQLLRPVETGE